MRSNLKFLSSIVFAVTFIVGGFFISNTVNATGSMAINSSLPTFTVDVPATFTVSTVANNDVNKMVKAHFVIPTGVTVEYQEGGTGDWIKLVDVYGPSTGFPLGDITSTFRGTFTEAGIKTVTVNFTETETGTGNVLGSKDITTTVVAADILPPTATVTQTGNSTGGTIIYFFNEPVQLMDATKTSKITITADKLGIYELYNYLAHVQFATDVNKVGNITSAVLSNGDQTMTIEYTGNLEGTKDMSYLVDAWGLNITDLAENKMVADPDTQVFTVEKEAPVISYSSHNLDTKTIVYTLSEPIQFVNQLDPSIITQNPNGLIKIYTASSYATRNPGDIEPNRVDISNTATYDQTTGELKIIYTGVIPAGSYLADTWGYTVTDLAGNKLDESNQKALFNGDNVPPTMTKQAEVSGKTITYTFSEPMQLVKQDEDPALRIATDFSSDKLGIYAVTDGTYNLSTKADVAIDASLSNDKTVLTVTYIGNLEKKVNTQYAIDAWGYDITDLAGNIIPKNELSKALFTIEASVPTATVAHDEIAKTITYTFSEPVQLIKQDTLAITALDKSLLGIYVIDSSTGNYGPAKMTGATIESANLVGNVLTIIYSGSLVTKADTYYVVDTWGYSITDLAGNVIAKNDTKQMFEVVGDIIPPTAIITHNENLKTITYTFDEPVQLTDANGNVLTDYASNLTIYDATSYGAFVKYGTEPTKITSADITGATLNGNILTITYSGSLINKTSTSYVIDAWGKNITDMVGNKMVGDEKVVFTIDGDNVSPIVTSVDASTLGTIVYTFSEPVKLTTNDGVDVNFVDKLAIYGANKITGEYGLDTITSNTINPAILDGDELTISYNGSLVKNADASYVVDAWGYKITDLVGNRMAPALNQIFTITGDTTFPIITTSSYIETPTNQNITVTAETNEGALNTESYTFEKNESFNFVATDAVGNVTTKTVTITNIDKETPVITAPVDVSVSTDAGLSTASSVVLGTPVTTDNVGVVSVTNNAPSIFPLGITTVTWTATDAAGNSSTTTQTVTVNDNENPTITAPENVTEEATGSLTQVSLSTPTVTDNSGELIVATNNAPINGFPIEDTTVIWTAKDSNNNIGTFEQKVTIIDTTAPVISGTPANITAEANSKDGAEVSYILPTAIDLVDGTDTVTCLPASGSTFALGNTTVNCSAKDAKGNESTSSFNVTVQDKTAPVITLDNAVVSLFVGDRYTDSGAIVTDIVDGTKTIDGVGTVDTSKVGAYTITYNYTDVAGNKATEFSRTVIVNIKTTDTKVVLLTEDNGDGTSSATIPTSTDLSVAGTGITAFVNIPADTVIKGPTGWDGTMNLPSIVKTVVNPIADNGKNISSVNSIEIGLPDVHLTFSNPVKITFAGDANSLVGWSQGGVFHNITNICNDPTNPIVGVDSDCKIVVGKDLVVWTTHFTTFTAYTQTAISHGGSGGYTKPVTPAVPANITTPDGCAAGNKFSTTTGRNCNAATPAIGKVLGAEKFSFTLLMKNGSKSNDVIELQKFLTTLGYTLTADGNFGPKTKAAVIKFQIANGLKGDGIIGALTRAALNK